MKKIAVGLLLSLTPTLWALEVPEAGAFSDPAFVKGFDAYAAGIHVSSGGPLLTSAEADRMAKDVLGIVQKAFPVLPETQGELTTTATVFSASPYSLTASLAFQNALSSFAAAQQLALLSAGPSVAPANEVFQKISYLYGMRVRLVSHTLALARSADWERARGAYPGGSKKFDRALRRR